jgi:hypothetical protein
MTPLYCSSMAHVVDRAWAFLFFDPPYHVASVRPDGVVICLPASEGHKAAAYFVTCSPMGYPSRGTDPSELVELFDGRLGLMESVYHTSLPKPVVHNERHACDECDLCCGMGCKCCSVCRNSK